MKSMKFIIYIVTIAVLFTAFTGCAADKNDDMETAAATEKSIYPMTITDSTGIEIKIEKEPMKVISVAPSITEILFAIGAGNRLIGRTTYCNYPEQVSEIQEIGTLMEPNIEMITSLKPDIVIAAAHFPEEMAKRLKEIGIVTAVLYGEESFEGVYDSIIKIAEILNKSQSAQQVVDEMKEKVDKAIKKVSDIKDKKTVYYALGAGKNDYAATGDTFISDMLEMAGGINVARDAEGWVYSKELLLEKDPDLIIASDYLPADDFKNMEPYNELNASKNDMIFNMKNADILNIAGPRLADGLLELVEIFYPELK